PLRRVVDQRPRARHGGVRIGDILDRPHGSKCRLGGDGRLTLMTGDLRLMTLHVRDVLPATPRARLLRIDLDGRTFDYAAGQASKIGAQGADVRKPYSIANAPEDAARDGWLEVLVGLDRAGMAGPHLTLEAGARVDVEGPLGTFTFPANPPERRFVFIGGGTGIAPLRAMLRHALTIPHREIGVFYSARTPDDFAFEPELRGLM